MFGKITLAQEQELYKSLYKKPNPSEEKQHLWTIVVFPLKPTKETKRQKWLFKISDIKIFIFFQLISYFFIFSTILFYLKIVFLRK